MKSFVLVATVAFILAAQIANAQQCTGVPVAGTLSAIPSVSCLSNPMSILLNLTGATSDSGIVYQWQLTPANNPTWPNAIISTSTTMVVTGGSYTPMLCRVRVFCTNSNQYSISDSLMLWGAPGCQDSVWPGDVNYDHIVDHLDALHLALAMGSTGYGRAAASTNYQAEFSFDWSQSFATTVNYKNADCDGNGTVAITDTLAIFNNYGLTHPKEVHTPKAKVTTNPDLYFDLTGIQFIPGATVSIPIKLGSSSIPINNIYGLASQVNVGGITLGSAPVITYNTSWLGTNTNTLQFGKAVNPNRVDWAYSRIDHQNTSGNGTLATLTFTIPTNATGQAILYFDNVKMIDNAGTAITGFNVVDDTANIVPVGISGAEFNSGSVTLVPNPSGSVAHIALSLDQAQLIEVVITSLLGEIVWKRSKLLASGNQRISLPSDLTSGIYLVRLNSSGLSQTTKWVKN